MDRDAYRLLEKIYANYRDVLQGQKKKGESLLVSSLEVKNNVRFRSLSEASVSGMNVEFDLLNELLESGFLREADEATKYTITARGIWEVEKQRGIMNESKLIDYLDDRSFNVFGDESRLSEKEKVIILSMIAARAFSKDSPVDLYRDDTLDDWRSLIEEVFEKLSSLGVVTKLGKDGLFGKSASERPISNLLRHTDALPRKTKALFKAPGKQRYFLDLFDGTDFSSDKLDFLVRLVFDGKITPPIVYDVADFCNKVAQDKSIRIFDLNTHVFLNMKYDDAIRESLLKSTLPSKPSYSKRVKSSC